jgi:hypothetical protein
MKDIAPAFLAVIAIVLAVLSFTRTRATNDAPGAEPVDLAPLLARLESLEERAAVPPPVAPTEAVERRDVPAAPQVDLAPLEARVARLERMFPTRTDRSGELVAGPELQRTPAEIEDGRRVRTVGARATILDPTKSEEAKLEAWRNLRHAGPEAWTDAVVAEMVRIGSTSPEARVRADVWRQADGDARHDALVPALLQALASDRESNVREEAAETLANYRGRREVLLALESAAANDAEEGVRRQARSSLDKGQARR